MKNTLLRVLFVLALLLSVSLNTTVQAQSNKTLGEGSYTVGKEIPAGLNQFSIQKGMAYLVILPTGNLEIEELLDSTNEESSNQYTANLKAGDEVDIYLENGASNVVVKQISTIDPKNLRAGFYQVGTNLSAGTYSFNLDKPADNYDLALIEVYDSKGNRKATFDLDPKKTSKTYQLVKGDQLIISLLSGTLKAQAVVVTPQSMTLNKAALNISTSQSVKVTATVLPANAVDKTVVWKSSNAKVATVDSAGTIKGIANGSATITATSKANTKVFKTVTVKVSTKTVKLNKTALSLVTGKAETLSATVSPADSVDKAVAWKSSNPKIATVDSKGKITAKAKGTATVTATVKGAKEVQAKVTVTAPIGASSVKMNKTSFTLTKGSSYALSATVSPSNATDKTIKWKSSDTKIATVDSKGKVAAVGSGTAKITAVTSNGKTATASVTVPYSKTLSAGKWKGGTHLPAGRYKVTTNSGSGNLFITSSSYDRYINEILSSKEDGFGVTAVTTDIKAGDAIEIMGLDGVQFTSVKNVLSNTLQAGNWTVGKDIAAGRYKITTTSGSGNLFVYRGTSLQVNEILASKKQDYAVTSVTTTLKNGDLINISGLNKVVFTKQ